MRLALFDLDHTLLDGDSDQLWCDFLIKQGLLDPDAMHSLGWEGFGKSNILKATWPEVKDKVDASFARYLEESAALPK